MSEQIIVAIRDAVSTVQMNRTDKKNALTSDMYDRMTAALETGETDPDVRAHLFLGGDGVFTAGNDIKDFLAVASGGNHGGNAVRFLKRLAMLKKPVVAGVDGLAIGIGTTMLLHCDLVYASPRSLFKTPFLDLGLVPEAASSLIAPRVMGTQRAFELLCLGEDFSADNALAAGIINGIVPSEDLEAHTVGMARRIAGKPPEALAQARMLLRGDTTEILERIDRESNLFAERLKSDEARQAFEAFLTKK